MSVRDLDFPVIAPRDSRGRAHGGCPASVPWSFVDGHQARAWANHGQTLEQLAERGGLAPCELHALVHDSRWRPMSKDESVAWLREAIGIKQEGATA